MFELIVYSAFVVLVVISWVRFGWLCSDIADIKKLLEGKDEDAS